MGHEMDQIDVFDPELYVSGPPHDIFDSLRKEEPVYWNPAGGTRPGAWVLTRFADTIAVSRDVDRFTSTLGFTDIFGTPADRGFEENIMWRDPPKHTAHRAPMTKTFSRSGTAEYEQLVRQIVKDVLGALPIDEPFDWVRRVAAEIPSRVVSAVLAVPEEDHGLLVEWANGIFGRDGSAEAEAQFVEAVTRIVEYSTPFRESKRQTPDSGVMSLLLRTRVDDAPLTDLQIDQWFLTLSQAGFETTHTLIAQGARILFEQPHLLASLDSDAAIGWAVEELLRYVTPVNLMGRTATQDLELAGRSIKAGDYVSMWYCAANRDPAVFDDPHTLNLDRRAANHQAFGAPGSPHYCLGAFLAKLEMKVLIEEFIRRGFRAEIVGPAIRKPGCFMNALIELPVVLR